MSGDVILDDPSITGDKPGRSFIQEMADLHQIHDAGITVLLSRIGRDSKTKLSMFHAFILNYGVTYPCGSNFMAWQFKKRQMIATFSLSAM